MAGKGFAAWDREELRALASKAGKASVARGNHRFTSEEARAAGRKGGQAAAAKRRAELAATKEKERAA